jgi:hypothetical protein
MQRISLLDFKYLPVTDFLVNGQAISDALALYKTVSDQESILIVKPAGAKCEHSEHHVLGWKEARFRV